MSLNRIVALVGSLAAACLLLVACGSSPAVSGASNTPGGNADPASTTAPTATPAPKAAACSPAPCATENGVTVSATLANNNLPASQYDEVPAGARIVVVNVTLKNAGNQSAGFNPFDFKLQDNNVQSNQAFLMDSQCQSWSAVTVTPGGTAGPQVLCFTPVGAATDHVALVWQPSFSLSGSATIPLN